MHRTLFRYLLLLLLPLTSLPLIAQNNDSRSSPGRLDLRAITRQAGAIFAGTVVSIQPMRLAGSNQVTSVRVTVQVEEAVRGVRAGERFTFSEWAGLWSSGNRYQTGERLMLFLYPRSAVGLTSPVGDGAGRLAIDKGGKILLTPKQQQAIRVAPDPIHGAKSRMSLREFARTVKSLAEE